MSTMQVSATLMEAIKHFSDLAACVDFMARIRWEDGPECPRCHSKRASFLTTRVMWKCLDCKKQYSVKVGSICEDSPTLDCKKQYSVKVGSIFEDSPLGL